MRKRALLIDGVLCDECFDKLGNLVLLSPRKFRCVFEDALQPTFSRLSCRLWRRNAKKGVNAYAQRRCQLRQDFATWRGSTQLPIGVTSRA